MQVSLGTLPRELWAKIFIEAKAPVHFFCVCKEFYAIFSETYLDYCKMYPLLKGRIERLSSSPESQISKLYQSLLWDIDRTENSQMVKDSSLEHALCALLKDNSGSECAKLMLNPDLKLLKSSAARLPERLAHLEQWLADVNLINVFKEIAQNKPEVRVFLATLEEKETSSKAEAIRSWIKDQLGEQGQLADLTDLNLNGDLFTILPTEVGQLTNLTNLGLGENYLTSVPIELGQLTNLTDLNLYDNELTTLPGELIKQLTNLTDLSLQGNNFTSLPAELGQLTKLTTLYFGSNKKLLSFPHQVSQLTNLTTLDLYAGSFTSLPSQLSQLTNLTHLNLDFNQLTSLPSELGRLTNLTYLGLDDNPITSLPVELERLATPEILKRIYDSIQRSINQLQGDYVRITREFERLQHLLSPEQLSQLQVTNEILIDELEDLKTEEIHSQYMEARLKPYRAILYQLRVLKNNL